MTQMILSLLVSMSADAWFVINDGVMGGVSSGKVQNAEDALRFSGELSLENNGGFASIRSQTQGVPTAAFGVRIQVRGDGRRYQFRIRQDQRFDGIAWSTEFSTSDEWESIDLPFENFNPVFRGRLVPQAGPVIAQEISQVGFLLADKNPGPFFLEVRSIEFLSN